MNRCFFLSSFILHDVNVLVFLFLLFSTTRAQTFDVLSFLPDERQVERIDFIMRGFGDARNERAGPGLASAAIEIIRSGRNQEVARRYFDTIKSIYEENRAVQRWAKENHDLFAPIYQWIYPDTRHQQRGYDHRDQNALSNDSDMNSDDDDDSRFGDTMNEYDVMAVTVKGAGVEEINGLYELHGSCDEVPKFLKRVTHRGRSMCYYVFRCKLSNGERRFYISGVPDGVTPGTTKDIDYYTVAPIPGGWIGVPPEQGWTACQRSGNPAPILELHHRGASPIGHGNDEDMDAGWQNDDSMDEAENVGI